MHLNGSCHTPNPVCQPTSSDKPIGHVHKIPSAASNGGHKSLHSAVVRGTTTAQQQHSNSSSQNTSVSNLVTQTYISRLFVWPYRLLATTPAVVCQYTRSQQRQRQTHTANMTHRHYIFAASSNNSPITHRRIATAAHNNSFDSRSFVV